MKVITKNNRFNPFDTLDFLFENSIPPSFEKAQTFPVEIRESEADLRIKAELPGIDKENLNIEYQDGILTLSGEKNEEVEAKKGDLIYKDTQYGRFSRTFNVGDIEYEQAKAEFKNGLLNIKLPKAQSQKPQKLQIK